MDDEQPTSQFAAPRTREARITALEEAACVLDLLHNDPSVAANRTARVGGRVPYLPHTASMRSASLVLRQAAECLRYNPLP